tara:strand:+ start:82 stop:201 length:120 start_codon:yes stop_codon:yes gene_type:complete
MRELVLQAFLRINGEECFFDDNLKCITAMQKITLKIKEI